MPTHTHTHTHTITKPFATIWKNVKKMSHTHMNAKPNMAILEKCKDVTHINTHKTFNNNPKYAKKLSHDVMRWIPHTQIIICSLKICNQNLEKIETRRKNLSLMKIYLSAHGR
jgi:hypothetical protein